MNVRTARKGEEPGVKVVEFVQLGSGTVYPVYERVVGRPATRPPEERTRVRGSGAEAAARVTPFVPHDAEYEKASDEFTAHLRHLGHEDG